MEVQKSAEELQREIDELHRRQREITERLRDPRGLRKGNGLGSNARSIATAGVRPVMLQRGVIRRPDELVSEEHPPAKKRLLSTVVKVSDDQSEKAASEKPTTEELEKATSEKVEHKVSVQAITGREAEEGQITGSRPNVQSDYPLKRDNRRGIRNSLEHDLTPVEPLPRVLPKEENPSLVKRNRRMFGALLGTLEKFRQEDKQLSGSDAFLRRSDSLKRAEQRAQEESEKLRQQERELLAEKRRRDLILRARLAAKAEEKQLELLFIQWMEHHSKLSKFLRTKSEPHIFYMSAKPAAELEKIIEDQQKDFEEWKSTRREELSMYQKEVSEQHLANVEAEIERWQSAKSRRNAGNTGTESVANEDGGASSGVVSVVKARKFREEEEEGDEEVEDMADDDIVGNLLEEDDGKDHGSEKELKGVVEYMSGDDDATHT